MAVLTTAPQHLLVTTRSSEHLSVVMEPGQRAQRLTEMELVSAFMLLMVSFWNTDSWRLKLGLFYHLQGGNSHFICLKSI